MRVQLSLCAQSTSIDRFTNRLSIFNVLESIEVPSFPILIPELTFLVILRRDAADPAQFDSDIDVRLGEEIIGKARAQVDFQGSPITRLILNFQSMPVLAPGDLKFRFSLPEGASGETTIAAIQKVSAQQA